MFTCPSCGKGFPYWVPKGAAQPKVKCAFCHTVSFPNGEPPAEPAKAPEKPEGNTSETPVTAPVN